MSCDCNTLVVGEAGVQGPQGLAGINGTNGTNGLNAFTTTSASFVQPSVGSPVTFSVVENQWIAVGQTVYISQAGFYTVSALGGSPFSSVTANLISTDGISVGGTVTSGRKVSPSASAVYSAPLASLTVTTGGVSSLDGPVTINESGNNSDFRVEGDGDTHLLFCDANGGTNGRVGVSIDAPETTLHVDGSFKVGSVATPSDAEFTKGATFNSEQSGSGTAGDFLIKTKNVSDTFFVDASADAVGIGTNTPSKLLDVDGAAEMNTLLVNPTGVAANPSFQVYGTNSTRPITVLSTNAPFNGVGIFKTTPTVELDVVGAATITGATILGSTLAVAGNLSVDTNVLKVDSAANYVGINKTTPTVALDVTGELAVSGVSTLNSLTVTGAASIGTTLGVTGASTLASLSVTGATSVGGNFSVETSVFKVDSVTNFVGVNTSSPTVALDVVGATNISSTLDVTGDVIVGTNVLKVDVTGNFVGVNKTTPTVALDVVGAATVTGATILGSTLAVAGNLSVDTNVLKVDVTGNFVGINNASPAVALDVVGATNISSTLDVTEDVTVGADVLKVDTAGTFVGINNASPTVALDVVGATNISGDLSVDTDVLKVDVTGNFVGINTASPTVALDVVGSIEADDYRISTGGGAAKLTKFFYGTGSGTLTLGLNSTGNFTSTITGASLGDFVQVSYNTVPTITPNLLTLFGYVSASNIVTIVVSNGSSTNVASQTYSVNILVTRAAAS